MYYTIECNLLLFLQNPAVIEADSSHCQLIVSMNILVSDIEEIFVLV